VSVVALWQIALDAPASRVDALASLLSDPEHERAARFATRRLSDRYVVAHAALRQLLGSRLGVAPAAVDIVSRPCTACGGPHGKPQLGGDERCWRFNLAHSDGIALVAIVHGREVGVDLERSARGLALEEAADIWLAESERAAAQAVPEAQRPAALAGCWARKEAYLKARGDGLNAPLRAVAVTVTPAPPRVVTTAGEPQPGRHWTLRDLAVAGHAAAVAVAGEDWSEPSPLPVRAWRP
jgi:4'-phosphopantetheinyl transferase